MNKRVKQISFLIFTLCAFLISGQQTEVTAQEVNPAFYGYPYNHLDWFTIEGDHFLIHFQEGNDRSAQVVSRVAEEVYGPITSLYNHEPDEKISIVLKDREDYSNGAAYFFDNKIDIWIPSLKTPFRSTHDWFRNVITHEFTHIIQIQASMKGSRRVPAWYVQWLNYEDVRRPDVLYGYPNGIITYPFAKVSVPAWLAEGTAQYQRAALHYDTWDSHRDMILRTRILEEDARPLSLVEMGTFASKNSLERETVYNHGYRFSIYLANRFGEHVLADISYALAQKSVFDVAEAIKIATGIDGYTVYDNWIAHMTAEYEEATAEMSYTPEIMIEPNGFLNLYPLKKGDNLYYLSNRNLDYSAVNLVVNGENVEEYMVDVGLNETALHAGHDHDLFSCGFSNRPMLKITTGLYDISDDGTTLLFSRNEKNRYGEEYNDLFTYNLKKEKMKRLTQSGRLSDPQYHPEDENLASAIHLNDGTNNIVLVNLDDGSTEQLTDYKNGEQIYTPRFSADGNMLIYAFFDGDNQSLELIDLETREHETMLDRPDCDLRDPFLDKDGNLYFSANPDKIFNIYRADTETGQCTQLTNVQGGAFMPYIQNDTLYYSSFKSDGYKLVSKKVDPFPHGARGSFKAPLSKTTLTQKIEKVSYWRSLSEKQDYSIQPLDEETWAVVDTGTAIISLESLETSDERKVYKYQDIFTKISIFPTIRFDNYTLPEGSNSSLISKGRVGQLGQNLWRDMKVGVNFASREVTDKFSLFGGAMFGFGSVEADGASDFLAPDRLAKLDRDLFLIAEYRGLPFLDAFWNPTISLEMYNLRRNVPDGLSVEEFPCVSCLPDTTNADIAYDIWEADIFLRSKLNRFSVLELGYQYSPYQVTTESFYSKEYQQTVAGSTQEYYKGYGLSAAYFIRAYLPHIDGDVAPLGLKGFLRYRFQPSELLDEYELKDGTLIPKFNKYVNHSVEFKARYGFKLFDQFFQSDTRLFSYVSPIDDAFFTDYIGGLTGLRSYPFFAIGGSTTAIQTLSWNVPLIRNINEQYGRFTFDKLFARFFVETGNGWNSPLNTGDNLKTGIGAELRFSFQSAYLFPSKFFISGAYGLNEFDLTLPEDFITPGDDPTVSYGREFLIHFGLLFDFDL